MDLATIIGLLVGFGALMVSVLIEGGKLAAFLNLPAALTVFGGTLGAAMVSTPLSLAMRSPIILKHAFFAPSLDRVRMIDVLVGFAQKARREGLLVLEEDIAQVDNALLKLGIQLAVDGTPQELVREILETEVDAMHERHAQAADFFAAMGGFAPTMGIIGTVMGLVHMLGNLSDPKSMGPAIASAFIATLYGIGLANLLMLPVAGKLKLRDAEEGAYQQMILEGILSIQSGDSPRSVEAKMRAFLSPGQKAAAPVGEA
ncbi:MAG TPA: flagellar motor protein [Armatimonadota bacterium]|nr:flagellar motor protein [Armatimonadota bacterium]